MRAAIFIDGGYLLKQLQDARLTPDYRNLAAYLLKPLRRNVQLDLMRCYFYYCPPWMSDKPTEAELRRMAAHERFVAELQQQCDRWQVRLGKLERRREGDKEVFAQKRVDVQLSVDMVQHAAAGHIQHAVLVAGDSDFIPAVIATKQSGATLTLWCDRDRSVHRDLMLHADEVHYFDWRQFPGRRAAPQDRVERVEGGEKAPVGDVGQPSTAEPTQQAPQPAEHETEEQAVVPADDAAAGAAVQSQGGRSRRRRGRRRGSGKGNAVAESKNELDAPVDASAQEAGEQLAKQVADVAPEPVPSEPQAVEAQPQAGASQPQEPVVEAAVSEPGEVTDQEAGGEEKAGRGGRRRRGGRGRRRKTPPNTPPVAE